MKNWQEYIEKDRRRESICPYSIHTFFIAMVTLEDRCEFKIEYGQGGIKCL